MDFRQRMGPDRSHTKMSKQTPASQWKRSWLAQASVGGVTLPIPLMRPQLPSADALRPYLGEIDNARWYTNFGPLLKRFEQRLAESMKVDDNQLVCVASGTLGLILALQRFYPEPGALCAMPSWTFEATPLAACRVGLVPWFLDVDNQTWAIHPEMVEAKLSEAPGPVAAVVPVSPFGAPVDISTWDSFNDRTGIPVVVDAAAGFDSLTIGCSPVVVSLHATKAFGIGEGGLVTSVNANTVERIRRLSNFGLAKGRQLDAVGGINAKLSEYAAAVGLASLDTWPAKKQAYDKVKHNYLRLFKEIPEIGMAPAFGAEHVRPTCCVNLKLPIADKIIRDLARFGVEARQWWGKGCHRHSGFAQFPTTPLPVTERLAESVIGLPFFTDLGEAEIVYVRDTINALVNDYRKWQR